MLYLLPVVVVVLWAILLRKNWPSNWTPVRWNIVVGVGLVGIAIGVLTFLAEAHLTK